jgi:hypothetical protein
MNTISDTILRRIRAKQRGWVFTPKDFLDLATRGAVDNILSRLVKRGAIRRIDKGIYDFPRSNSAIGKLSPNIDDLAKAVAKKSGDKIFPSGAMAANLLGFSTQVPAKASYLTDGVSKDKKVGNRTISFKHARVPFVDDISFDANLALQALSYMGKNNIDDGIIQICTQKLSKHDILSLNKAAGVMPAWLVATIHKLQDRING